MSKGEIIAYLIECTDVDIEDIEQADNVYSLLDQKDWENIEGWR